MGWILGFVAELAWLPYLLWLHQWVTAASTLLFMAIFARNWAKWRRGLTIRAAHGEGT